MTNPNNSNEQQMYGISSIKIRKINCTGHILFLHHRPMIFVHSSNSCKPLCYSHNIIISQLFISIFLIVHKTIPSSPPHFSFHLCVCQFLDFNYNASKYNSSDKNWIRYYLLHQCLCSIRYGRFHSFSNLIKLPIIT